MTDFVGPPVRRHGPFTARRSTLRGGDTIRGRSAQAGGPFATIEGGVTDRIIHSFRDWWEWRWRRRHRDQSVRLPTLHLGTLLAPELVPGPVTVDLDLLDLAPSVLAPSFTQDDAQTIQLPALDLGLSLFAPAVAAGTRTLTLPVLTATPTLAAPRLVASARITLPVLTATPSLVAPAVEQPAQTIILPLLDLAPAVDPPAFTLADNQSIVLPSLTATPTLFAPTVVPGGKTVTLPRLDLPPRLFGLTVGSRRQVNLPRLNVNPTVVAPTVRAATGGQLGPERAVMTQSTGGGARSLIHCNWVAGGDPQAILADAARDLNYPRISPNRRRVLFASAPAGTPDGSQPPLNRVEVVDANGNNRTVLIQEGTYSAIIHPEWWDDLSFVACYSPSTGLARIGRFDAANGALLQVLYQGAPGVAVTDVAVGPGHALLFCENHRPFWLGGGQKIAIDAGDTHDLYDPYVDRWGDRITLLRDNGNGTRALMVGYPGRTLTALVNDGNVNSRGVIAHDPTTGEPYAIFHRLLAGRWRACKIRLDGVGGVVELYSPTNAQIEYPSGPPPADLATIPYGNRSGSTVDGLLRTAGLSNPGALVRQSADVTLNTPQTVSNVDFRTIYDLNINSGAAGSTFVNCAFDAFDNNDVAGITLVNCQTDYLFLSSPDAARPARFIGSYANHAGTGFQDDPTDIGDNVLIEDSLVEQQGQQCLAHTDGTQFFGNTGSGMAIRWTKYDFTMMRRLPTPTTICPGKTAPEPPFVNCAWGQNTTQLFSGPGVFEHNWDVHVNGTDVTSDGVRVWAWRATARPRYWYNLMANGILQNGNEPGAKAVWVGNVDNGGLPIANPLP